LERSTIVTQGERREPLTEGDISEFAQKLETWGQQLPAKERLLLQLLVARAERASDVEVQGFAFPSIAPATNSLFSPLVEGGSLQAGVAWADIWRVGDVQSWLTGKSR
jgi:hypothetical protein